MYSILREVSPMIFCLRSGLVSTLAIQPLLDKIIRRPHKSHAGGTKKIPHAQKFHKALSTFIKSNAEGVKIWCVCSELHMK